MFGSGQDTTDMAASPNTLNNDETAQTPQIIVSTPSDLGQMQSNMNGNAYARVNASTTASPHHQHVNMNMIKDASYDTDDEPKTNNRGFKRGMSTQSESHFSITTTATETQRLSNGANDRPALQDHQSVKEKLEGLNDHVSALGLIDPAQSASQTGPNGANGLAAPPPHKAALKSMAKRYKTRADLLTTEDYNEDDAADDEFLYRTTTSLRTNDFVSHSTIITNQGTLSKAKKNDTLFNAAQRQASSNPYVNTGHSPFSLRKPSSDRSFMSTRSPSNRSRQSPYNQPEQSKSNLKSTAGFELDMKEKDNSEVLKNMIKYSAIKHVSDEAKMKHYLKEKKGWENDIANSRWEVAFRSIKGGGDSSDMDIFEAPIEEWEWPQVVWWLQTFENFGELARVFGEYHINGLELAYMKPKQMQILVDLVNDDKKSGGVNSLVGDAGAVTQGQLSQIVKIEAKNIVAEVRRYRIGTLFRKLYQQLWARVVNLSNRIGKDFVHFEENYENMNDEQRKAATKELNGVEKMAKNIVYIIRALRAKSISGAVAFWKSDAIFFDKVDNHLACLLLPPQFQKMFRKNFPEFIQEPADETEDGDLMILSRPGSLASAEEGNLGRNKKKFTKHEIETIGRQLIANVELKDFKYNFKTYTACVTGTEIVDYILHLYLVNTRRQATIIANKLFEMECISTYDPFDDLSAEHKNFKDRATYFYRFGKVDQRDTVLLRSMTATNTFSVAQKVKEQLDQLFWKPVLLLVLGILSGSFLLIAWRYSRSLDSIKTAMEWTVSSVEQHSIAVVEYEFSIPQIVLNTLITALYTGDLPTGSELNSGAYDSVFAAFTEYSGTSAVYDVFVYNQNEDLLVGVSRNLFVEVYDGSCYSEFMYNASTQMRTDEVVYNCSEYDPMLRPWYNQTVNVTNTSVWTEPYDFAGGHGYGMSLAQAIEYNGTTFVFVAEFTVDSLQDVIDQIRSDNLGDTILYLATGDYNVIGSTKGGIDLQNCDDIDCQVELIFFFLLATFELGVTVVILFCIYIYIFVLLTDVQCRSGRKH